MKKLVILLIAFSLLTLAGCQGQSSSRENAGVQQASAQSDNLKADSGDVVEIKEKMFLAQFNDICLNPDDYLGKTIKYEGMFTQYTWEKEGITYYMVYRQSPGCCGADGQAGFEVVWPEGTNPTYPKENDWVEVTGVLEEFQEDGITYYLRLKLSSLTVLPTRGAEFVNQ